jgi:hypothetical protein
MRGLCNVLAGESPALLFIHVNSIAEEPYPASRKGLDFAKDYKTLPEGEILMKVKGLPEPQLSGL